MDKKLLICLEPIVAAHPIAAVLVCTSAWILGGLLVAYIAGTLIGNAATERAKEQTQTEKK